jgi:glc operon protein GlcG
MSSVNLSSKPALNLEAVKKIAAAAEAEAKKNNWNVVISIVDDGGNLIRSTKPAAHSCSSAQPKPSKMSSSVVAVS